MCCWLVTCLLSFVALWTKTKCMATCAYTKPNQAHSTCIQRSKQRENVNEDSSWIRLCLLFVWPLPHTVRTLTVICLYYRPVQMKNDQFSGEIKYTLFVCQSMSSLIKIFDASSYFIYFFLLSLCLVLFFFSALFILYKKRNSFSLKLMFLLTFGRFELTYSFSTGKKRKSISFLRNNTNKCVTIRWIVTGRPINRQTHAHRKKRGEKEERSEHFFVDRHFEIWS